MNNIASSWCESANMKLEIITPVSIAADYSLTPWFYIFNPKSGEVFYLNTMEWFKFLQRKRILSAYENELAKGKRGKVSLYEWLCDRIGAHSITEQQLGAAILSKTKAIQNKDLLKKEQRKSLNNIKAHIRLVDGTIYIPGSSIKGSIRTAILYHILIQNKDMKMRYWREVKRVLINDDREYISKDKVKDELGKIEESLKKELIFKLQAKDKDTGDLNYRSGALADVLSGLRCSDASPIGEVKTEILQKIDLTLDESQLQNKISSFRESILPGSLFRFSISIEKNKLNVIGIHSVDELVDIITQYYDFINDTLATAFMSFHSEVFDGIEEGNFYLGGNTGFYIRL